MSELEHLEVYTISVLYYLIIFEVGRGCSVFKKKKNNTFCWYCMINNLKTYKHILK